MVSAIFIDFQLFPFLIRTIPANWGKASMNHHLYPRGKASMNCAFIPGEKPQ
jgi:hypothetical protein